VVAFGSWPTRSTFSRYNQAVQKAVRNGIARASETLRNPRLLEVTEIPGHIVDGDVGHLQVTMNIRSK
jgi:hypothetical protein